MTLALIVREKHEAGRRLIVEARATNARGDLCMSATLDLVAPLEKAGFGATLAKPAPHEKGARGRRLLEMTRGLPAAHRRRASRRCGLAARRRRGRARRS